MQIYTKMYELIPLVRDKTKTSPHFAGHHIFSSAGLPKYLSFPMNKMNDKPWALSPKENSSIYPKPFSEFSSAILPFMP